MALAYADGLVARGGTNIEEALRVARGAIAGAPPHAPGPSRRAARRVPAGPSEPLRPGWWRQGSGGDRDAA